MILPIQPIRTETWNALLAFCRSRDVEEGDSPEYMYSVRTKSSTLVIWTQAGWKGSWFVGIVAPAKKGKKLQLTWEGGNAPDRQAWDPTAITEHLLMILHKVAPLEQVTRVQA
jgi:hypothetical protein